MEEVDTNNTKVSDSAYSTSCNSKSQRSSNSSKSQHSNSSASSGYCGHPSLSNNGNNGQSQKNQEQNKIKKQMKFSSSQDNNLESVILPAVEVHSTPTTCSSVALDSTNIVCDEDHCSSEINSTSLNDVLQTFQDAKKLGDLLGESPKIGNEASTLAIVEQSEEKLAECRKIKQFISNEDKFYVVVSLLNGLVMYTSSSVKDTLGFPKDMWIGRSFIDFVHPKDRVKLSDFITARITDTRQNSSRGTAEHTFFCCLRKYRSLKSVGYGITETNVTYLPFQLNLSFRDTIVENNPCNIAHDSNSSHEILLLITAELVTSAYKYPDETCASPKFTTQHLASCKMSFVDFEAVSHLGYLPQDMIDCSVFDFYHPEDLPFIKEVYENVIRENVCCFHSKPYRFRVQNGGYVLLETEWSKFINPWSRKLELIVCHHRILKGPSNPDVFAINNDEDGLSVSEEILKESKIIQEEIQRLLIDVPPKINQINKSQLSKRCKDLTLFMESLINKTNKSSDLKVDVPQEEQSFSEHDSVMLGEISPHHEYYDSKSSSGTPPSYNQLNYHDNIQRFFESKPKTTLSDGSVEMKTDTNEQPQISTDEEVKNLPVTDPSFDSSNRKCVSPINVIGNGLISEITAIYETGNAAASQSAYKMPHLTQALLSRHNEDMEKQMVQKHREQRIKGCDKDSKNKDPRQKNTHDKAQDLCHGVKRSGSHSWECEPYKSSKFNHKGDTHVPSSSNVPPALDKCEGFRVSTSIEPNLKDTSNIRLWPQYSVSATPTNPIFQVPEHNFTLPNSYAAQMRSIIPVYYIPTNSNVGMMYSATEASQDRTVPSQESTPKIITTQQSSYFTSQGSASSVPKMMYTSIQPVYGVPHIMYPSPVATLLPATLFPSGGIQPPHQPSEIKQSDNISKTSAPLNGHIFRRPASLATSIKAEPGSIIESVASASVKREMSESSKKESVDSQEEQSIESSPENHEKSNTKTLNHKTQEGCTGDDTSNSLYSFLKTEKSEESIQFLPKHDNEVNSWEKIDTELQPATKQRPVLKDPPWLEDISVTSELIYRYKLNTREMLDVLEADKQVLTKINQPVLVNEQLHQLYADMESNASGKMDLEESLLSSGSSGEDYQFLNHPFTHQSLKPIKKKTSKEYTKLVMIFEENAPFPPPIAVSSS